MPIEADILLAQSADDRGVGVSALGMSWQIRPPEPIPWALVLVMRASRDLIGKEHLLKVNLEMEDGSPVSPDSLAALVRVEWPYIPEGLTDAGLVSPVVEGLAFNLLPVPLEESQEFRFRLWVDQETRDHWVAPFRTTEAS